MTIQPRKDPWQRLVSGLYVPPLLNFSPGYPCGFNSDYCRTSRCACGGPASFEVALSGITNSACGNDADCTRLNDSFFVTFREDLVTRCWWEYTGLNPDVCPSVEILELSIWQSSAGPPAKYKLEVGIDAGAVIWLQTFTVPRFHCLKLSNESIPYVSQSWFCDASSSTCLVSAV